MKCPLCSGTNCQQRESSPQFYNCPTCGSVFRNPSLFLSSEKEKQRYLLHENDVDDPHYQAYVRPVVEAVAHNFNIHSTGLDYGAGTGPVITKLLKEKGYQIKLWDPFFHPNEAPLLENYDFVICCEVIEHFHKPLKEFKQMKQLLHRGGKLICMTQLLPLSTPFKGWNYKNDPTHVIFYSEENLKWIQNELHFSELAIKENLIVFSL